MHSYKAFPVTVFKRVRVFPPSYCEQPSITSTCHHLKSLFLCKTVNFVYIRASPLVRKVLLQILICFKNQRWGQLWFIFASAVKGCCVLYVTKEKQNMNHGSEIIYFLYSTKYNSKQTRTSGRAWKAKRVRETLGYLWLHNQMKIGMSSWIRSPTQKKINTDALNTAAHNRKYSSDQDLLVFTAQHRERAEKEQWVSWWEQRENSRDSASLQLIWSCTSQAASYSSQQQVTVGAAAVNQALDKQDRMFMPNLGLHKRIDFNLWLICIP